MSYRVTYNSKGLLNHDFLCDVEGENHVCIVLFFVSDSELRLTEVVERSLLSLLFIPLLALVFLLVWKVS